MLKNLKIDADVHELLKKYCLKNSLKMNDFASNILSKFIMEKINERKLEEKNI